MVYKTCSINKVLAQVYRDFKPSNSAWLDDAVEWIADAAEIMGAVQGRVQGYKIMNVVDHRVKLPCEADEILGIEYKKMRLQRSGGINHKNAPCSCLDNMVCSVEESYFLNPNYIQTTFKEGCITVYYNGIEVDCDGLPTIIDDAIYREALTWYVLMKMIGRGFKHQVFTYKDAMAEWNRMFPRAQNRCRMPDIDRYEIFKKSWLGLARSTNLTNEFFNTVVAPGRGISANTPGTLVETFQILGQPTP